MDKKVIGFLSVIVIMLIICSFIFYNYHIQKKNLDLLQEELNSYKQKEETQKRKTCFDSDNGLDYYTFGYIEFREYDEFGSLIATSDPFDVCVQAYVKGKYLDNALREYYCDSNNNVQYETVECPNGCFEGVCY